MANYSRSKVETYARCPRQYELFYVKNVPNASGPAALVGIALHEAVEEYTLHLLSTKQRSDKEKFNDICQAKFFKLTPEGFLDAQHVAEEFVDSYVMLLDYVHGIEVKLEAPIGDGDFATGVVDRLDVVMEERVVIHDYKSSRSIASPSDIGKDFQMLFYGWLAAQNFPEVAEIHAAQLFIRYGVTRNALLDWDDINGMGEYVKGLVARLKEDGEFKPQPNSHCRYCPGLTQCINEHWLDKPQTDEDILKLYIWGQAAAAANEPHLRQLASEKPIEYDSETLLGYWDRTSQSYQTQAVIVACTALGLDPADFLQAKGSAVNKLAKRKDEWGRVLREARQYKTSTYFGKKAKQLVEKAESNGEEDQ